jgi:hypothetical protein
MRLYKVRYLIANLSGYGDMHYFLYLDSNSDLSLQEQAFNHVSHNCMILKQKLLDDKYSITVEELY